MRICSFLPSATEIVCALGMVDSLWGVSHECDYPPEVRGKRRVVRSRFDPADYTSQEIDSLVADMTAKGERIYSVDVAALREARPDLVITQELCEVCAVSLEDVQRAVVHLDPPPQVLSLDPSTLDDVLGDIETVGEFTGQRAPAEELITALRERIERVRAKVAGLGSPPRVACIEWLDPLIVAGHWIPEMVRVAGGWDGLGDVGSASRRVQMDELSDYRPEILILMPCGMDVDRTVAEFALLDDLNRWTALPAVQGGRVYAVDAGALFSRSGPRLIDGLELMAQIVHPDLFPAPLPTGAARRLEKLPLAR